GRQMTAEQQRELDSLRGAEREAQRIAEGAMKRLRANPDIAKTVGKATETMEDIRDMLQKTETGEKTQGKEDEVVNTLDRAIRQSRQAMRDQRQHQQAAGQQHRARPPGAGGQRKRGGDQRAQK